MATLFKLTSNVDKVLASLDELKKARLARVYQIAAEVAIQALADAQTISPVDTGLYRAAHDLTINEPSGYNPSTAASAASKAHAAGLPAPAAGVAGSLLDPSTQTATAASRLESFRSQFKGTMTIFLTNNLQYAWALENGHSQQAPHGVYGIVRQRAIENFKKGGLM